MTTVIGDPITLKTDLGSFKAYHFRADSTEDTRRRAEGMVLSSIKNSRDGAPVMVRIQSSCLFSESFQSRDCDCALQLISTLSVLSREEGLIIYHYDEGRGMGLEMKFRSIRLQQLRGIDSMAACRELNIAVDSRSYIGAADTIRILAGDRPVVLLSNNPHKEKVLLGQGLDVLSRRPLICGLDNPDIVKYLSEKRRVFSHDIPDLL